MIFVEHLPQRSVARVQGVVLRARGWGVALMGALLLTGAAVPAGALPGGGGAGISTIVGTPYDGTLRAFNLYVSPKVPTREPVPLLMVLHGLYLDPSTTEATSGLDRVADSEEVALVYPYGIDGSWNAGTCCGTASAQQIDDVGFLAHVVDTVAALRPIDRRRVYVAGFSNGGMMSLRAVCARPDVFAAAASVGGTLQSGCLASSPVSALLLHGQRDTTVPYAGTSYSRFLRTALTPVPTAALTLAKQSGCVAVRTTRTPKYQQASYRGCGPGSSVELVSVPALGHHWPTTQTDGVDGEGIVWNFLSRHRLAA